MGINIRIERPGHRSGIDIALDVIGALSGQSHGSSSIVREVLVHHASSEDNIFGRDERSHTEERRIMIRPSLEIASIVEEGTIFGKKISTMWIEGLDGMDFTVREETTTERGIHEKKTTRHVIDRINTGVRFYAQTAGFGIRSRDRDTKTTVTIRRPSWR